MIDYSKFPQNPPKRKHKPVIYFLVILSLISVIYIFKGQIKDNSKNKVKQETPVVKGIMEKGEDLINSDKNSLDLESLVQNDLKNTKGEFAVSVKNLKSGEHYYYNEQNVFDAASLYKLFIMATIFQKIESGDLTKGQVLSQTIPVLNQKFRISSESAELKEGSITLPVQSALTRMITISDNYSALLLAENARLSNVTAFLQNNAFLGSKVGTKGEMPATTASDMTSFFQKLYFNELASAEHTADMLLLLRHQQLNNKIPKYLPEQIRVAHKTGELGRFSHDAGIVYTPKGDYIIVVLSDTNKPVEANEKIAIISKTVYDYFTRK